MNRSNTKTVMEGFGHFGGVKHTVAFGYKKIITIIKTYLND